MAETGFRVSSSSSGVGREGVSVMGRGGGGCSGVFFFPLGLPFCFRDFRGVAWLGREDVMPLFEKIVETVPVVCDKFYFSY